MHELSEAEVIAFQAHFFECADCFEDIQFKRNALQLIRKEGEVIFPEMAGMTLRQPLTFGKIVLRSAAVAAAVLIFAAAGYYLSNTSGGKALQARLNYDRRPPFAFASPDVMRASSATLLNQVKILRDKFNQSMNAYKECDYGQTAVNLEFLEPDMAQLSAQLAPADSGAAELLREYHFYYGLTKFALAGSRKFPAKAEQHQALLAEAVTHLLNAAQLTRQYQLGDGAKVQYFLGLSYGVSQQHLKAVATLRAIESDDPRFADREEWIKLWSN
jgi:hypothetical protein